MVISYIYKEYNASKVKFWYNMMEISIFRGERGGWTM